MFAIIIIVHKCYVRDVLLLYVMYTDMKKS